MGTPPVLARVANFPLDQFFAVDNRIECNLRRMKEDERESAVLSAGSSSGVFLLRSSSALRSESRTFYNKRIFSRTAETLTFIAPEGYHKWPAVFARCVVPSPEGLFAR
jgi:hypothetical protein